MPLRICLRLLLVPMIIWSCSGDKKQTPNEADLIIPAGTDTLFEALKEKQEVYTDWKQFHNSRTQGFSIDSFGRHEETNNELIIRQADISPEFYRHYGKLLTYNNDSSLFIDAFSYSVIIEEKDGELSARGGEADQEVAVVNPATKERKRIFFCGPPCTIAKAVWIDNKHTALFGLSSDDGMEGYKPMIWIVNIDDGHTAVYEYNGHTKNTDPHALLRYVMGQEGILME